MIVKGEWNFNCYFWEAISEGDFMLKPSFFHYHHPHIFPKNLGSYEEKSYLCRRKAALGKLKYTARAIVRQAHGGRVYGYIWLLDLYSEEYEHVWTDAIQREVSSLPQVGRNRRPPQALPRGTIAVWRGHQEYAWYICHQKIWWEERNGKRNGKRNGERKDSHSLPPFVHGSFWSASGNGHRASTGGNSENEGIRRDYQVALEHIGSRLFSMPLRYANLWKSY